jgi:hypothetical protein
VPVAQSDRVSDYESEGWEFESLRARHFYADVAELADAHDSKSCSFGSVGSTPTIGTKKFKIIYREVAQLGRAPGLGPGGRRFKSCLPDHSKLHITNTSYDVCYPFTF